MLLNVREMMLSEVGLIISYFHDASPAHLAMVVWELDAEPIGFSVAGKIVYGREAHMHLHIVAPRSSAAGMEQPASG